VLTHEVSCLLPVLAESESVPTLLPWLLV
jgi:hypothetical protein